jgi:hypothetical protein
MKGGVRPRSIFITALEPAEVDALLAILAPVAVLYEPFNKDDPLEAIGRAGNWHGAHSMTLRHKRTTRLLAALALFSAAVLPQAALTQPAGIEPQAEKLLKASMAFLAAQKRFSVDTRNTIDVVLTSGQKLQFGAAASASVQRPNKMRAERKGDLVDQVFVYDGKSLTLYNPGQKYYATVGAPGTLDATLDFARTKLDVIAPGGDLLYANAYEILMENVTSGFVVGKAVVEGVRCDHLAFRGAEVDWQIWLQEGKQPLPRKWLITTKDIAGSPEFEVVMTKWNLAPNFADGMFDFKPSKGARKVDFLPLIGGTAKPR